MNQVTPTTGAEFVPAQKNNEIIGAQNGKIVVFVNKGKVAKEPKPTDYNLYGNDFANFSKFKGNDKHDAMRLTNACATDVKKAYMQLQHEFPDVVLEFDEMPDPQKCGKGREGFFTYQQYLDDWKDCALRKIEAQREISTKELINVEGEKTRETVINTTAAEIANDDLNTAIVLEQQERNAKDLKSAVAKEGAATRSTVRKVGEDVKKHVSAEAGMTRDAVFIDGTITRIINEDEHERTRSKIHSEAKETREALEEEADRIRSVVRDEADYTREKIDDAVKTLDPTGAKRIIRGVKRGLGF